MIKHSVFTDLDGTLLNSESRISESNLQKLIHLRKNKVLVVAATGRTLYSAKKVISKDCPFDYLIFSSGAGIVNWQTQQIVHSNFLNKTQVISAAKLLKSLDLDFSIHYPIPDNHCFYSFPSSSPCTDFLARVSMYKNYVHSKSYEEIPKATQLLAISIDGPQIIDKIKTNLSSLSIIRATSPLDHVHTWIEIFPAGVSKGDAARWLCENQRIPRENTMGIGNDYNDLHLLSWTSNSYMVQNAATEIKKNYINVASNDNDGFCQAVEMWLKTKL